MAVDVSNFIIQPDNDAGLYQAANTLRQTQYREAQLQNQRTARMTATSNFIKNALDRKNFLNGSPGDIVQGKLIDDALNQAYQMASKGVDAPTIMQSVGPLVERASAYNINSKLINKNIDDQLSRLKQYKGYNLDNIKQAALANAFFDTDPKTGQRTLKQDIGSIDPSIDYVHGAINNASPGDALTTGAGLAAFAKDSPKSTRIDDFTDVDQHGNTTHHKAEITAANWEIPEKNAGGGIELVPKYQTATDGGVPLLHDFTGTDGKTATAPVRLFDENEFNKMLAQDPSAADHIKTLVRQHIKDYNYKGNPIDINSPQAKYVAQAEAYDYLKSQGNSKVSNVEQNKMSPQQINLNVWGTKQQQAYNTRFGRNAADNDNGPKAQAGNAPEAMIKVALNDPDAINVPKANINGRNVLDVTGIFPKGGIKAGIGDKFRYRNVYWDGERRQFIVEKETGTPANKEITTETITDDKLPQFLNQIAKSNNSSPEKVRQLLQQVGYKNGAFGNVNGFTPLDQPKNPDTEKLNNYFKDGKQDALKGIKLPMGKIDFAGERSGWNPKSWLGDSYKIEFTNGKTKTFKTKDDMEQFILKNVPGAQDNMNNAPATQSPTNSQIPNADQLIDKYR